LLGLREGFRKLSATTARRALLYAYALRASDLVGSADHDRVQGQIDAILR
jgi:hypothetical protein